MHARNRNLLLVSLLAGAVVLGGPSATSADTVTADLKQQLESGLKARRPVEFEFIARVVAHVEAREVPIDMVYSVLDWSRKKNPRRPFPHFEQAIRTLAARLGVDIQGTM